jgi:MFS family permease
MTMLHTTAGLGIDLAEFRRAWRIVVLATLGIAANAAASMLYAFGAFTLPWQQAFGWERSQIQSAIGFLFLGAVPSAQLVGWLNRRYGMKRVTSLSLLALSAAYVAMTQMGSSITSLYGFLLLLALCSMGTMHVTWTHLVNLWYDRNRGLALALVLSGTGMAAIVIPAAVSALTARWGWQAGVLMLAVLPAGIVLPLVRMWMVEPDLTPDKTGSADRPVAAASRGGIPFRTALRSPRYWALNLALSMVVAAIVTMVTSTVPLLRDKGLDAATAGRVFGSFGLSLIGGRVLVGYLIDRFWAPGVAAVAIALPAVGCWLLSGGGAPDTAVLTVAVMLIGVGAGAEFDIAAFLVARYFGLRDYGHLFGVHLALITLASTLAPWVFGQLYKSSGSYTLMLTLCGGMFLGGAMMLLPLGRYPRFDASASA